MDKEKEKVLDDYVKYRRLRNHSKTLNDIRFHISKFIYSTKKTLKDFDDEVLLNYLDKITPKYSIQMLNNIKSSYIKNFVKWYYPDWSLRFRNLDVMCKTEKAGATYEADDMISEEEFGKLIKAEESIFWKAYFLTLFYGCCRPVEVSNLMKDKIEFEDDGAYITIYSKKNKTSFIKFVPSDVAFYLKKIIDDKNEFVFCNSRTKKPINVKTAYARIRGLSKKVLGHQIDLYTLRHSIATINYGKDIKDDAIARQMGHTKSMKGKYVHNDKTKLKEIARSIYVSPEDLPPEKKHELELRIEKIEMENKNFHIALAEVVKKLNLSTEKLKGNVGKLVKKNVKGVN
ncbi:MAG: tyrosine-type recombinase/integrase [archaeon]